MRGMGCGNVDHRLRQSDFSLDNKAHGGFWLGMPVSYMSRLNRMLVVGANLRKDHQLMAHRIRASERWYGELNLINAHEYDFLGKLAQHQPCYSQIHALAQDVARLAGASFGVLGEAANIVGAVAVCAIPG